MTSPNLVCSFGDLGPGGSRTVVVSAATSIAQCEALPTVNGKLSINNNINGGAVVTATNADEAKDPGLIVCDVPVCDITIDKTCSVALPPVAFSCEKPFDSFSVEWNPGLMTDAARWVLTSPNQEVDLKVYNGDIGSTKTISTRSPTRAPLRRSWSL